MKRDFRSLLFSYLHAMPVESILQNLLEARVRLALEHLVKVMKTELVRQKHRASGATEKSFRIEIDYGAGIVEGRIISPLHTIFLERGTKPHRPPFDAIYNWTKFVFPGIPEKSRRSLSWAIIQNIAKEGTPSAASLSLSETGKRTEFTKDAISQASGQFFRILDLENYAGELVRQKLFQN